jgi:CubicO group peptidase (beta-lactamase class C family)
VKAFTLGQLLPHNSGTASDNDAQEPLLVRSLAQPDLNLDELGYWMIRQVLARPSQSPPSKRLAYSNIGYTLAGEMIERIAGAT